MRRIMAFLLSVTLILSFFSFEASAGTGIIAFPEDGGVIGTSERTVVLNTPSGCDVSLILDGDEISSFLSSGSDTVEVDRELSVGQHSLAVVCSDEFQTMTDEVSFKVEKSIKTEHLNEAFNGGKYDSVILPSGSSNPKEVGVNSNGEKVYIKSVPVVGTDGEAGSAVGFVVTDEVEGTMATPTVFYQVSIGSYKLDSYIELEYDLMLCGIGAYEIETNDGKGNYGAFGPLKFFAANGSTSGSDYSYPKNEWIHMKHQIDVRASVRKESLTVTDSNGEHLVYYDRDVHKNVKTNLAVFKLQYYVTGKFSGTAFAIDNLSVTNTKKYSGFGDVSFFDDSDTESVASDSVITSSVSKIALDSSNAGTAASTDYKNAIKVCNGDKVLGVKSAATDSQNKLVIELEKKLPSVADVDIFLELEDSLKEKFIVHKQIKSRSFEFGLNGVSFESDGSRVISSKQLKPATPLKCSFSLVNNSAESQTGLIILCIYDGVTLVSLNAKEVEVASSADAEENLEITIPEASGSYSAECYLFDSFKSRIPISKIWSLK